MQERSKHRHTKFSQGNKRRVNCQRKLYREFWWHHRGEYKRALQKQLVAIPASILGT